MIGSYTISRIGGQAKGQGMPGKMWLDHDLESGQKQAEGWRRLSLRTTLGGGQGIVPQCSVAALYSNLI